jgi:CRP-like cAMP-binding protein
VKRDDGSDPDSPARDASAATTGSSAGGRGGQAVGREHAAGQEQAACREQAADRERPADQTVERAHGPVAGIPVAAGSVRWERPTARSFWNALADPEREALAAAGVEEFFRPGTALCRAGDDTSQVMIIDSGWVKASVRDAPTERREEDRMRLFPGERAGAERRLAWLLLDLAQRRGGYQHTSAAVFTLPMSQQELADWAGTSPDAVARFLRSWRSSGIIARSERSRRLTVVDLDGLAALCDAGPPDQRADRKPNEPRFIAATQQRATQQRAIQQAAAQETAAQQTAAQWQQDWIEPLNCSIVFTDVAGFSDPVRTDGDREVVRATMYEILRSAFEASRVPWAACYREDRGDGALIVVPPTISTHRVVDPFIAELAGRLRQHNRRASEVVRIQLRVALHVGPVGKDAEGLTGQAVIAAARILDAPVIKARLAAEQADLVFATSDYVYEHVVHNCDLRVDPTVFEHMECQVKESHVSAWVHLAGRVAPQPPGPALEAPADGQAPAGFPGPLPVAAPLGILPPEVRGREGLIGELRRALRPYPWRASRAFVIAGMGGLGKSTVALTAARMARERGYRVWWVRAADSALLTSGMLEVLRELGAPESVVVPVREGARTAPSRAWEFLNGDHLAGRRWLLVFDGADNPAVLAGADAATPADGTGWLRADPAGMVIVTTRIRDPQVWGTGVTLRELKPLDDEAGAEVLRDLAPEVADPGGHQARELSRRLGGLPLALHLAGAYLGSPFARWSTFAGYCQALDGVELPAALTDVEEQGADIHATVQRTWDLSLDALAAEGRPQAGPLLLVLSCFAPATPIPAWLLRLPPLAGLLGEGERNGTERRGLRGGLQGLSRTGLIEIANSGSPAGLNSVMVHPVVADANRIRLAASADAEHAAVQETAVALLEAATAGLDPGKPDDWPTWRLLRPHVNAALDLLAEHPDTLSTEHRLGWLIGRQGRYSEAIDILNGVLGGRRNVLGDDHPDTLTSRATLAWLAARQGRRAEAEALYRQVTADRTRVLGVNHPDTAAVRAELAHLTADRPAG